MHYRFALGSLSKRKVEVIEKVLREFEIIDFSLRSYDAPSSVPKQPFDEEVERGSYARAVETKKEFGSIIYCSIGLEYGFLKNNSGTVSAIAYCTLIAPRNQVITTSSRSHVLPKEIATKVLAGEDMDACVQEFSQQLTSNHPIVLKQKSWLQKDILLAEAFETALVGLVSI